MISISQFKNKGNAKGSIADNDEIVIFNSENAGKAIVILFSTLKAALKTYFDTLYSGGAVKATEVTVASNTTLTVANVSGTIITNYGQGASTVTATLPTAEAGLNFVAIMGTTQGSYQWKLKAGTNDKIFLDGTAGTDNQCAIVTPEQGNAIHFCTFKTGSSSWDWKATTLTGVWTAGA